MAEPATPVREALLALRDAGIDVLVLREPDGPGTTQVLVHRADVPGVVRTVDPRGWRYAWELGALHHLVPMVSWWWDGGHELEASWSCPAAPLPPRALARLTQRLWDGSAPDPADGLRRPDAASAIASLAVQAARPGAAHDDEWDALVAATDALDDASPVLAVARGAGVERGVARALAAAREGRPRPGPGALFDGPLDVAWRLAVAAQGRLPAPRLRHLAAGQPTLGDATIRVRVGGAESLAGPGVFVPTPDADLFVEAAEAFLRSWAGAASPVVVEAGAGCGAIALAVAAAHPDAVVHGTELDPRAVAWARRGARRAGLERVGFHAGSLLDPLPAELRGRVDLLLANLPFYPADGLAPIGSLARETIASTDDAGLDLVRRLAADALPWLRPGSRLVVQLFEWQWATFRDELAALGYRPGTPRISGPFAICPADRPA